MPPKNAPRFLDYRRSELPLDVALTFASSSSSSSCPINDGTSARDLILSGRVSVNDVIETSCHHLVHRRDDKIAVAICDDKPAEDGCADAQKVQIFVTIVTNICMPRYFICYKPRGVVCSSKRNDGIDRVDSVLISDWLANLQLLSRAKCSGDHEGDKFVPILCGGGGALIKTVGRLDEESEGLILLTNDGSFSRLLCDPEFGLKKTYRVVVRGSGYSSLIKADTCDNNTPGECAGIQSSLQSTNQILADKVAKMIKDGNQTSIIATGSTMKNDKSKRQKKANTTIPKAYFPYESCQVIDAGKLPTQHTSDDSYYAIVDLVLREGKRHAVRRIIKNAGDSGLRLRVCYLSRIAVEGLEDVYHVVKPKTIVEAQEGGFLPEDGQRHCKAVPPGKLVYGCISSNHHDGICTTNSHGKHCFTVLQSGHVLELRDVDIDKVFRLRS